MKKEKYSPLINTGKEIESFLKSRGFLLVLGLGLQPIFHFPISNLSPNKQNAKNKDMNRHLRLK